MEPDIAALLANISFWEGWGYVALAAVLIGVAGESIKEFTPWLERIGWEKKIGRISALILIAGLAGEGVTQPNTNAANAKLIALLNKQTAQLRLDLEARKNRSLTDAQKSAIIERLKPLPDKGKIIFNPLMTDGEAIQFSDQIKAVLKAAGYDVEDATFGERMLGLNRVGSFLWIKDAKNPPQRAKDISTAFRLVGITIWGDVHPEFTDPDEVMLVVSTHP